MAKFGKDALGAWLLKCNPEKWDIEAFLADGHRMIGRWSVQDNVRAKSMSAGEPAVFWVSGSSSTVGAGAWGIGTVAGPVASGTPDDYWLTEPAKFYVPLDLRITGCRIPRVVAKQNPVLAASELVLIPRMSNPVMLTPAEWFEFQKIWASQPGP